MRNRFAVLALGLLLASATSTFAQARDPFETDFSANFDFIDHQHDATSNVGGHFDIASTVTRDVPFLVVLGEVGINHFDNANVASFVGGARLRFPNISARVLPFLQIEAGLYHCGACDTNDFTLGGGGGLDFKLPGTNAARIRAQLDVRHMFESPDGFNAVRVSAGVVLPLNQ